MIPWQRRLRPHLARRFVARNCNAGGRQEGQMEVSAEAPFTVTFSQQGFAPNTVSVKIQPGQMGVSDPKFAPNPVFAQLAPVAGPPKPAAPAPAKKKPPPKP
jgi:hypothetical protein